MSQKPAPPRVGPSPAVATPWPLAVGLLVVLSATAPVPAAEAETDPVLAAAPERIRKHRTGSVTVKVVDRTGKPVAGAEVLLRQRRRETHRMLLLNNPCCNRRVIRRRRTCGGQDPTKR